MGRGGFARVGAALLVLVSCGNTQKQTPGTNRTDSGGAGEMPAAGGDDADDDSSMGGSSEAGSSAGGADAGAGSSAGGVEAGAGTSAGGEPSSAGAGGSGEAAQGHASCQELANDCGANADQDCCAAELVPGRTGVKVGNATEDLEAFLLDRYEVTVGRYRKFLAAVDAGWQPQPGDGKHPTDKRYPGWSSTVPETFLPREGAGTGIGTWTDEAGPYEDYPVNKIEWRKAFAFCIWDGGRLPTKLELREAAQGGDEQRFYPWSSPAKSRVIDSSYAAYGCNTACTVETALRKVGTSPLGNGRFGHADLSGNVWEWVADVQEKDDTSRGGWARGGAFFDVADYVRAAAEINDPPYEGQGLRCARSPESE